MTAHPILPSDRVAALDQALRAAGIPIIGVSGDPPEATIEFAAEATQQHRDDAAAIQAAFPLTDAKRRAIEAIDARSEKLLTAGLEVATGKVISTSLPAQQNLTQLVVGVQGGLTTLPQGISTIDGGEYIIADAQDLSRVARLWADRLTTVLDAGRALRLAVLAAESVEEVAAITDART